MKFTLSWLKEHLDTKASLAEIAETLTRVGLEVEEIIDPAERLKDFVVARVLEAEPHPNADKLRVCKVDAGKGAVQVVCGAPNARKGLLVVFAQPGTYVPGLDVTLGKASIRGVESMGMMCSERELELSQEHNGIIELPESAAGHIGERFATVMGLDDPVIHIKITPNRPDCLGRARRGPRSGRRWAGQAEGGGYGLCRRRRFRVPGAHRAEVRQGRRRTPARCSSAATSRA